jgi:hypothetical protein
VLDFVNLIFFPDVGDFSCGCFLFSGFFPFIKNENENEMSKILKKNYDKLRYQLKTLGLNLTNIPEAPELTNDKHVDHAYGCIRSFELQEMSYSVKCCSICNECDINMKLKNGV